MLVTLSGLNDNVSLAAADASFSELSDFHEAFSDSVEEGGFAAAPTDRHDAAAVEKLITDNIPLVGHLVRETLSRVPSHVNRDDLVSAGLTALVQAGQAFNQAATLLHDDPTPFRNLGLLYQYRGFGEQSLEHFVNALRIDPYDLESLRGATWAGKVLHKSDPAALERLQRAQMIENDPKWRDIITRERIRVENDIREATERT